MKVNTDGVLLGAWADVSTAKQILDIGTGTGVIALMLAQRQLEAKITAIDIDQDAAEQATDNALASPWAERVSVRQTSLQDMQTDPRFDLIVSNPPYFVNDYISDNAQRNIARHSGTLSYHELIAGMDKLLTADGCACIILPFFNVEMLLKMAVEKNIYLTKRTDVIAVAGRDPYVSMIALSRTNVDVKCDTLTIQNESGAYTDEYRHLTRDFYLKF